MNPLLLIIKSEDHIYISVSVYYGDCSNIYQNLSV